MPYQNICTQVSHPEISRSGTIVSNRKFVNRGIIAATRTAIIDEITNAHMTFLNLYHRAKIQPIARITSMNVSKVAVPSGSSIKPRNFVRIFYLLIFRLRTNPVIPISSANIPPTVRMSG